uniref:Linker histone H1 and H5 family protein n=1 Tax=Marseillevirus LCMAC101 TaxID=2506602 RepID=A0A481YRD1_9VIRU|nr:MAG: linker histone H1 and H5 family protein [Marseillevirus LCMAC101]
MCILHLQQQRAFDNKHLQHRGIVKVKHKAKPPLKRVNTNTLAYHISRVIWVLGENKWKVSLAVIKKWFVGYDYCQPTDNMLKKRLREMVEQGELVRVKLSYKLGPENYHRSYLCRNR